MVTGIKAESKVSQVGGDKAKQKQVGNEQEMDDTVHEMAVNHTLDHVVQWYLHASEAEDMADNPQQDQPKQNDVAIERNSDSNICSNVT